MKEFRKFFAPVGIGVILVWALWWWFVACYLHAQLGDLFGGINALFSGLALAGVVTAVILQSKELQLQRNELQLSREQFTRAAEANEKAAESLAKQIDMQVTAAELAGISSLLNSIHSQLDQVGRGSLEGQKLSEAVGVYHGRLHKILQTLGR